MKDRQLREKFEHRDYIFLETNVNQKNPAVHMVTRRVQARKARGSLAPGFVELFQGFSFPVLDDDP